MPTISVQVGGVEYHNQVDWGDQGLNITQVVTRKGDTADLFFYDYTRQVTIPPLSPVTVTDGLGHTLFAGLVTRPRVTCPDPLQNVWELNCQDWTYFAQTTLANKKYINTTMDKIATDLFASFPCGITTANVQAAGAPYVPYFQTNRLNLAAALDKLVKYATGGLIYNWYIDAARDLHFFNQTQVPSADCYLTSDPTDTHAQAKLYDAQTFWMEDDGTQVRNQITVRGGQYLSNLRTDNWIADGRTNTWIFTSPPDTQLGGLPIITVGGVQETVAVAVGGGAAPTTQWQVVEQTNGTSLLQTGLRQTPAAGTVLQASYFFDIPVLIRHKHQGSINYYKTLASYNGGVYEKYVGDTTITTQAAALARAQAELQQYALHRRRAHAEVIETYTGGLAAGQQVQVINGQIGLNQYFLIQQCRIVGKLGNRVQYQLDLESAQSA